MLIKNYFAMTAIISFCVAAHTSFAAKRKVPLIPHLTETEKQLVSTITSLFSEALENNEFGRTYTSEADGRFVELTLEAYPQSLVTSAFKSTTPSEALELLNQSFARGEASDSIHDFASDYEYRQMRIFAFDDKSEYSSDEEDFDQYGYSQPTSKLFRHKDEDVRLDDGSAPLRLRKYASRHHDSKFPFKIILTIKNWQDLTSLKFLYHPMIEPQEDLTIFRTCLYSLEVSDCGITLLKKSWLSEFENLTILDLHNNKIATLCSDNHEEKISALEYLDLSDNKIVDLNDFFKSGLMWLTKLSLANNLISELPKDCLSGLIMLNGLNLAYNFLRDEGLSSESFSGISSAAQFFNLRVYFDNNCLTVFPCLIAVKDKLLELSLDDNPIDQIPNEHLDFPVLSKIHLKNQARPSQAAQALKTKLSTLLPTTAIIVQEVAIVENNAEILEEAVASSGTASFTTPTKTKW